MTKEVTVEQEWRRYRLSQLLQALAMFSVPLSLAWNTLFDTSGSFFALAVRIVLSISGVGFLIASWRLSVGVGPEISGVEWERDTWRPYLKYVLWGGALGAAYYLVRYAHPPFHPLPCALSTLVGASAGALAHSIKHYYLDDILSGLLRR